jgi:hypothetical protein
MSAGRMMLLAGALINGGIAVLHVFLGFAGEATERFFGAPPGVVQLAREGRALLLLLCLGMAGVFGLFALYGLSGAGRLRRLPILRGGLITIGAIYTLRGLALIGDLRRSAAGPGGHQFAVFSLVALLTGLLMLGGTVLEWKELARFHRR